MAESEQGEWERPSLDSSYILDLFPDQDSAKAYFECAICLELLKDPVQVRSCGHLFCRSCIDELLR